MTGTRRLAAIMFVDMVGYTTASQTDESGAIRRVHELDSLLQPIIVASDGRKIKSTGDGMLIEFDSALKASQCAVEIQRQLHDRIIRSPAQSIQLRVGVHLGDVEEHGGDILGDAVNIAARIEPLAEPGGVWISGEVYAQVRGKSATRWEAMPPKELKGIQHPVSLYRAVLPWNDVESPATPADRSRLAVLPFANFSPEAHDEYIADGLTEELITVLAKIEDLRVIARTSVFPYKNTAKPMAQIGAELGVSSILEGSVRKAGDRIRVTAQLIDVPTQAHRWAETYDRKLEDIFAVQTEVAGEVAKALEVRLGPRGESRPPSARPVSTDSYLAYLQGRTVMAHSFSESGLKEAQAQFERALALDSANARACAALSQATHLMGVFHHPADRQQLDASARELADRAIQLDPNLADGHSALGLLLYDSCEWHAAEAEARLALSLNPGFSDVRLWYSMLLQEEGRGEEAHRELSLAFDLDPQSRVVADLLTELRIWLRLLDPAQATLERLRDLDSAGRVYHSAAAWYYLVREDVERARSEAALAESTPGESGHAEPSVIRAIVLAKTGHPEEARDALKAVEAQRDISGTQEFLALGYAILDELDESFRILDQRLEATGSLSVQALRLEPFAEPIRRDPRFAEILKRLRLTP